MTPANTTVIFTGWTDAIRCMCGVSTYSTTSESDLPIPVIYQNKANAEASVRESQDFYDEEIQSGERDADDVYEGEAAEVHVLNDGSLYFPEWGVHCSAADACGTARGEIDMVVMGQFNASHCFDYSCNDATTNDNLGV